MSVYKDSEASTPQELKQVSYRILAYFDHIPLKTFVYRSYILPITWIVNPLYRVMLSACFKTKSISYIRSSKII